MALTDIEQVRLYANSDVGELDDNVVQHFIDEAGGNIFAATALAWMIKAGRLARKIDVSTAQTRLALSKQHDQHMAMVDKYAALSGGIVSVEDVHVFESVTMATADPADPESVAYWPGAGAQYSDD